MGGYLFGFVGIPLVLEGHEGLNFVDHAVEVRVRNVVSALETVKSCKSTLVTEVTPCGRIQCVTGQIRGVLAYRQIIHLHARKRGQTARKFVS